MQSYEEFQNYQGHPSMTVHNDSRFIGPFAPLLGGAILGYMAGRPNAYAFVPNYIYPQPYYPYAPYPMPYYYPPYYYKGRY